MAEVELVILNQEGFGERHLTLKHFCISIFLRTVLNYLLSIVSAEHASIEGNTCCDTQKFLNVEVTL